MSRTTSRIGRPAGILLAVFALALTLAAPSLAAAPNVNTGAPILVDGNFSDWTESDFFADMYRAGKSDKEVESKLFLRYDCTAGVLYVGVVAVDGVTIIASDDDNFVKFGQNDKKVDGSDAPPDATQPNFAYAAEGAGWEASFAIGQVSITDLNVHAQVEHDGSQTSAVADRAIPMTISCTTGGEELSASLRIVKDATGEAGAEFAFGDASLADGEFFDLLFETEDFVNGAVQVTVTETLTADHVADLWSLKSITCDEEATVEVSGSSVTVTLSDGDSVTCTFVNEQGREGIQGGNPTPSPTTSSPRPAPSGGGELPDTSTGTAERTIVVLLSLALVTALGAMLTTRAVQRR